MTPTKRAPPPSGRGERLFRDNLDLIEKSAVSVCHLAGLDAADTDDFRQDFLTCLMENGYAVLEHFQGRSSLSTFLISVARRRMVDFRAGDAGRYRPTALAHRLGPVAVELEKLMVLRGLTRDQAVGTIRTSLNGKIAEDRLHALAELLPDRHRRRFEGEDILEAMPSAQGDPREIVRSHEAKEQYRDLMKVLVEGLDLLEPLERLVVVLTLLEPDRISDLARSLDLDQRQLYAARQKALRRLRQHLRENGIGREALELFEDLG